MIRRFLRDVHGNGIRTMREFAATSRRFRRDRGGNVAMLAAGLMVPLLVSAGLSIDAHNVSRLRSDIQSALDAATMEMAVHLNSGRSDDELEQMGQKLLLANLGSNHPDIDKVALRYLGTTIDADGRQNLSAVADYEYSYLVPRSLAGDGDPSIDLEMRSRVSAALGEEACIYALSENASRAINAGGNTDISVDGCVIASNSAASDSIYVGGSAALAADCLQAVGGIDADTGLSMDCERYREHAWRAPDSFAALEEPMPAMLLSNPRKTDTVVAPGRYRDLTLDGIKTLGPGLYYIDGSLSIKGEITGTGVTIFMKDGAIRINGNASLSLEAPQTGDYAGMLFWSARSNTSGHVFNGNGATDLTGNLYFPRGSVDYSGNNGTTSNCMRIVADTITFTGSSTIRSDCTEEMAGRKPRVAGALYFSR
jgi:hypothetical protein